MKPQYICIERRRARSPHQPYSGPDPNPSQLELAHTGSWKLTVGTHLSQFLVHHSSLRLAMVESFTMEITEQYESGPHHPPQNLVNETSTSQPET